MATTQPTMEPGDFPDEMDPLKLVKRFGGYSIGIGILLVLLGIVGVILPELMSLEAAFFIATLFIVGGVFWAVHTYKYNRANWPEWMKPVLLLVSGVLMLIYPMSGVAAVGLLLAIYLLLDGFGSFVISSSMRPMPGWGWMAFNGVISLFLAMLFLIGWPSTSLFLVGLYVAISLFFDGVTLIYIGWTQRKIVS